MKKEIAPQKELIDHMMTEDEYGYMKLNPDGGMMFPSLRVRPIELHEWEKGFGRTVVRVVIKVIP